MGSVPIGKSVEVVPEAADHPILVRRPGAGKVRPDGTVAMSLSEFDRGLDATPPTCEIAIA